MRHRTLKRCVLFSAFVFFALAQGRCQQRAPWREFNLAAGFPESSSRSVTVSANGAALAAGSPLRQLCQFDGYEAKSVPLPEGPARVYQSPAGQLWTITGQGLWTMKDHAWQ